MLSELVLPQDQWRCSPRKANQEEWYQKVLRNVMREALRLAKFEHPNIVKVHQVFRENNTVYIAMDYVDAEDLLTILEVEPDRMTPELVKRLLDDMLGAVAYIHDAGILHRDISPDNVLLDANDKLTLIDFGAAQEDPSKQTRALSVVMSVKDGYSPHEFYYTDGEQRPSSDIYSVGATFYQLITGFAPPDCQTRVSVQTSEGEDPYVPLAGGDWDYEPEFLAAIDKALSIPQKHRFQTAREWSDLLAKKALAAEEAPQASEEVTQDHLDAVNEAFEIDPNLDAEISSLVERTNVLVKAAEAKKPQEIEEAPTLSEAQIEECLVDIFGEPIDDVDAWLEEQDQLARLRKRLAEAAPAEVEKAKRTNAVINMLGLSRLVTRLAKTRQTPASKVRDGKEA